MKKATGTTNNGGVAYEHSYDHLLEFFSKAGSLFVTKEKFYEETTALDLFKSAWYTGKEKECMQLLFWLRDIRHNGSGNRSAFRSIINWLATTEPKWIKCNIDSIPFIGRWDDLKALYNTECEVDALKVWSTGILSNDSSIYGLACKWANRQDSKLRSYMGLTPKQYRKLLVSKTKVVEQLMCSGKWEDINFNKVPSKAMVMYNKAFENHVPFSFNKWKESLSQTDSKNKVNASVLFPHDIAKVSFNDTKLADAQFNAMPNYLEGTNQRIMNIVDMSASMDIRISGSINAIDVSCSLGVYCSEMLGKDNPFYRKIIPFSEHAKFYNWNTDSFSEAFNGVKHYRGWGGSTNIKAALDLILDSAITWNVKNDKMPNVLMITSDMQFDSCDYSATNTTIIEECLTKWETHGYTKPKIIFWNLAGCYNQPATKTHKDVALISGFSPAILSSVFKAKDFTPLSIMKETISIYKVNKPI